MAKHAFQFIPESGTTPRPSQPAGPGGEMFSTIYLSLRMNIELG